MLVKAAFGFFLFTFCMIVTMVVISLYPNDRNQFLRLYWRKSDAALIQISKNSKINYTLTRTSFHNTSTQYIWCVNHYGPNNQIKDFVKCAIIAVMNNYTLIIPPLYPHYGDNLRGIQWFDHFYDLKQLGLVLNYITLDQMVQQMKNKENKVLIDCYVQQYESVAGRSWYSKNALGSVQNYYKTNINFQRYINLTNSFNMNELSSKVKNCSSIFLHIHYMAFAHFFSSPNNYSQQIFQHLRRTTLIQRMTSQLISLLPQLITGNYSKNKPTTLAVAHMRLGDHTVMSVSMYIKQILHLIKSGIRFTHLHIMCPYLNSTEINQLTSSLPVFITTTEQVFKHVRFVLNDYLFDVLEQEVALQAPIFIASPWTTYSATVVMQKVYQQKGTVYLFSTKRDSLPFLVTKKNVKYFKK